MKEIEDLIELEDGEKILKIEMKEIEDLIELEEGEKILKIEKDVIRSISLSEVERKQYDIENYPPSIFNINGKYFSYVDTHVFTNQRYIYIGFNFWQLKANFGLMNGKITINNNMLIIPKEHFHSFCIQSELRFISFILDDIVQIHFRDYSKYESFRKFLIDNWDFSEEESESAEKKFIKNNRLEFLGYHVVVLIFEFIILIRHFLGISSDVPLFYVVSFILLGFGSICDIILIFKAKKNRTLYYAFWGIRQVLLISVGTFILFFFMSRS